MHVHRYPLAGLAVVALAVVALAGCAGSASRPAAAGHTASGPAAPSRSTTNSAAGPAAGGAGQAGRTEPETKAGARAAAARFNQVYLASRFAASWDLLAPAARHAVKRDIWIRVHERCVVGGAAAPRIIGHVTVFGNAAIVTERVSKIPPPLGTSDAVFNYVGGRWGYSPSDLGIYGHGSAAADVAAAKKAGLCTSRNASLL
ncbi:MAG: hypothetical protein ACRDRJ_01045 [Streptosporangiaceae bacterium]